MKAIKKRTKTANFVQLVKTEFGLKQIKHSRNTPSGKNSFQMQTEPYEGTERTLKRKRERFSLIVPRRSSPLRVTNVRRS